MVGPSTIAYTVSSQGRNKFRISVVDIRGSTYSLGTFGMRQLARKPIKVTIWLLAPYFQ